MVSTASLSDLQDAIKRANYASRLGTADILPDLITALDADDKSAFIARCGEKLTTANTNYTQAELDDLFDDFWTDSKASHRTANKPCW